MPSFWLHPAVADAVPPLDGSGVQPRSTPEAAEVLVLPWPIRPTGSGAWVAWVAEPSALADAVQAGADAVATPSCPLAGRVLEAHHRHRDRVLAAAHQALFELAPDPMEITDPEATVLDVNPAWERHTGIPRAAARGRTPAELFRSDVHPASFYEALQGDLRAHGVWRGTMIGALPGGELAFQSTTIQHVDHRGQTVAHVALKRVGTGVKDQTEPAPVPDVPGVLAQTMEATLVLDQTGVVVAASPRALQLLGHARAACVGRRFTPFELGVPLEPLLPAPGAAARADITLLTARGPLDVEIDARGATGGMRAFAVWVVRDITARKRTERALTEAREAAEAGSRAKSRFLANMSHELRTPLNIILGYTELLEDALVEPEVLRDLRRIHQAGHHLLELVGDILDLARIESGRSELAPEPLQLDELVGSVAEEVRPLVEERGNRLEVQAEPVVLSLDRRRIRQVLLNLVGNAAKFTEQGVIHLRLRRRPGEVLLEVEDEGIGMSEEEQGRVFQSFTQANEAIKHLHGGTGLGLTISRSLVLQMGGRIDLSSAAGRGTCFTVVLPDPG